MGAEDCGEGHVVICKNKKKVGIWSNARGEFLEEPHKGHVLHFKKFQILLDVYPKEQALKFYHYFKGGIQEFEIEDESTVFWLSGIYGKEWNQKLKVNPVPEKGIDWLGENIILTTENEAPYPDGDSKFSFEFDGDNLEIKLFTAYDRYSHRDAVKSILKPEFDSIDVDGNVVYYPRDKAVRLSGVFDTKQGKWVIPSKYQDFNKWEGIYAAYIYPEDDTSIKIVAEIYDFYKKDPKMGIQPTKFMNTQEFAFPLELWPLESEEVWYDYDSIYIYHRMKGKVGMYEVPIRGKNAYYDGYSLEWFNTESHFEVKELFRPEYEYILLSGNVDYYQSANDNKNYYILAAKEDSIFDVLFISAERDKVDRPWDTLYTDILIKDFIELTPANIWNGQSEKLDWEMTGFIDHTKFLRIAPENGFLDSTAFLSPKYKKEYGESEEYYKAKFIGNDKISVFSYRFENRTNLVPLIASDYGDSIDVDGNIVYYAPDPGCYASGLFDCNTSKWKIPPMNISVIPGNDGYVIQRPILNEYRQYLGTEIDFMKSDGTYEFQGMERDEFAKPKYNEYKIYNYDPVKVWKADPNKKDIVYFTTEKGVGLSEVFRLRGKIMKHPTEMLYYQHFSESIFAIDGDSLDLTIFDAITPEYKRLHHRIPIESGSGIQVFGNAIPNYNSKWYDNDDMTNSPLQFVHFTQDTAVWWELKKVDGKIPEQELFEKRAIDEYMHNDKLSKLGMLEICGKNQFWEFKVEAFTDDLIYFQHNEFDGRGEPYRVMDIYFDQEVDSLDFMGNVVYQPGPSGFTQSGVWNRSKKDWEVPNIYKSVEHMSGNIFLLESADLERKQVVNQQFFIHKNGELNKLTPQGELAQEKYVFEVGKINDSLIFINDYREENRELIPQWSFIDPLTDSIDANGNVVYIPQYTGEYYSGVYNVHNEEWLIQPHNFKIFKLDEGFIVATPVLNEDGYLSEMYYSIYDQHGVCNQTGLKEENLTAKQIKLINSKN